MTIAAASASPPRPVVAGACTPFRSATAFAWRVFEGAEDPRRFEEVFYTASWLEYLRQHRCITRADAELQATAMTMPRPGQRPWRRSTSDCSGGAIGCACWAV